MSPPRITERQSSTRPNGPPRPRRRFGQNFLTDARALARIVDALGPGVEEAVVEAHVLRASGAARLQLGQADRLDVALTRLGDALAIAGNLPYNVSKPV